MIPAESIKSKGYTVKGALAFVEKSYGAEGRQRVVEALEPEIRNLLKGVIVPSSWYPFKVQVSIYEATDRLFGAGDLALCRQIGRFTAEYELSTIHAMLLKLGKPEHLMKLSGAMWGRYYSAGKLSFEGGKGAGAALVSGFNPISKAFCMDLEGWMQRTLELTGVHSVVIKHTQCLLDGAPACRYEGTWQA